MNDFHKIIRQFLPDITITCVRPMDIPNIEFHPAHFYAIGDKRLNIQVHQDYNENEIRIMALSVAHKEKNGLVWEMTHHEMPLMRATETTRIQNLCAFQEFEYKLRKMNTAFAPAMRYYCDVPNGTLRIHATASGAVGFEQDISYYRKGKKTIDAMKARDYEILQNIFHEAFIEVFDVVDTDLHLLQQKRNALTYVSFFSYLAPVAAKFNIEVREGNVIIFDPSDQFVISFEGSLGMPYTERQKYEHSMLAIRAMAQRSVNYGCN